MHILVWCFCLFVYNPQKCESHPWISRHKTLSQIWPTGSCLPPLKKQTKWINQIIHILGYGKGHIWKKTKVTKEKILTSCHLPPLHTGIFLSRNSCSIACFLHPAGSHLVFKIELKNITSSWDFPGGTVVKTLCSQCRRSELVSWLDS